MSYEAWRISFQDSEQAARAAYAEMMRLCAELVETTNQLVLLRGEVNRGPVRLHAPDPD